MTINRNFAGLFREESGEGCLGHGRAAILAIKMDCSPRPKYRKEPSGTDIYSAVLDLGVRITDGFDAFLVGSLKR